MRKSTCRQWQWSSRAPSPLATSLGPSCGVDHLHLGPGYPAVDLPELPDPLLRPSRCRPSQHCPSFLPPVRSYRTRHAFGFLLLPTLAVTLAVLHHHILGPSGGHSLTHLMPGGGVPRVQGPWSPVRPRLPHFATHWSVRRLTTVVAGAYPPRGPPNAWSPRMPALRGRCYWLVASGTTIGWRRGGCVAAGQARSAVSHYCLGTCERGAPGRSEGDASSPTPPLVFPPSLVLLAACVLRVFSSGCPFPLPAGTPIHAVCVVRGVGLVALQVRTACRLCVCALLHPRCSPLPLVRCSARTA